MFPDQIDGHQSENCTAIFTYPTLRKDNLVRFDQDQMLKSLETQRGCALYKVVSISLIYIAMVTVSVVAQGAENGSSTPWQFEVNVSGWMPDAPATIPN